MQFEKLNDVNLHYQVIGAPAGKPTLVFINSLGSDFRIWRDVIVRLVGEYALVTYDKRGHGLSDVGSSPYKIEDHRDDLEALLEFLDVKNAILCGVSVGGLIAQSLYDKRPELIRGLILCDTAPKIGTDTLWNERIAILEKGGIPAFSEEILDRWFCSDFKTKEAGAYAGYKNMVERTPLAGYVGTCAALRDADLSENLAKIDVPTICIVGEEDGSTPPELVGDMAKRIPNARYQVIPKCGHIPSIEAPDVLADVIRGYFDEFKIT